MFDHVPEYLSTGVTCQRTSDEACEAAHQRVRQREQRFQTRRTRFLTGPTKVKKSKQAITKFNSLNKGF